MKSHLLSQRDSNYRFQWREMWLSHDVDMRLDLLPVWLVVCVGSVLGSGRYKRIINGDVLTGHDNYNTNYMVSIRDSWGCEMYRNTFPGHCEGVTRCGGALISSEFVVTACHCMLYEDYRIVHPLPHKTNYSTNYADFKREREEEMWRDIKIRGVLTTILIDEPFRSMSLWMGSIINDWTAPPQTRGVKVFYPHSKCSARLPNFLGYSTARYTTGVDIGLIRAWSPFNLNHDVGVAWYYQKQHLIEQYFRVKKNQQSCLFLGFGKVDETEREAPILNHMFGHVKCVENCPDATEDCAICSTFLGSKERRISELDSGGPVVCDRWLFGVIASGVQKTTNNDSIYRIAPLVCVNNFISEEHLEKLKAISDEYYSKTNNTFAGGWAMTVWKRPPLSSAFSADIATSYSPAATNPSPILFLILFFSPLKLPR